MAKFSQHVSSSSSSSFIIIICHLIKFTAALPMNELHNFPSILKSNEYNIHNNTNNLTVSRSTLYVPFDPEVIEGDMPSSRKKLLFEKESLILQKATSVPTSEITNKQTMYSQTATPNAGTGYNFEETAHPEEINYIGKEEYESSEHASFITETSTDEDTSETPLSELTDINLSDGRSQSVSVSEKPWDILIRTESRALNNKEITHTNPTFSSEDKNFTAAHLKNYTIAKHVLKSYNDSVTVPVSNYKLSNTTVIIPDNSPLPLNFSSIDTTKINVKFTISAEDTRLRTKEDSQEEIPINANQTALETGIHNKTIVKIGDNTQKILSTFRQPKTVDVNSVNQNNLLPIHKNHSISSSTDANIHLTTQPLSTGLISRTQSSNITFQSPSFSPIQTSSSVTMPPFISETLSIFKAFSDMKDDARFQKTISILTKNKPITNSTWTTVKDQIPSSRVSEYSVVTHPSIERATIRKRILKPLLKATANSTKNHPRTRVQSAVQEFKPSLFITSITPLPKILNETVAPPVSKLDDISLEYPMDMPDQINFLKDSSSTINISPKAANTILISSIIGGCAIIFFTFLMIFCMCKQRRNNWRSR